MIFYTPCERLWKSDIRALQFAVPVNCILIGCLSFLLPIGPLSAALMLDAFLLAMAAIGITGKAAVLIVPNVAIKFILLLILLFVGCVSIDTFHNNYSKQIKPSKSLEVTEHPPSYAYCISHTQRNLSCSDELPSYEEALQRKRIEIRTQPSKSRKTGSVVVFIDVEKASTNSQ